MENWQDCTLIDQESRIICDCFIGSNNQSISSPYLFFRFGRLAGVLFPESSRNAMLEELVLEMSDKEGFGYDAGAGGIVDFASFFGRPSSNSKSIGSFFSLPSR